MRPMLQERAPTPLSIYSTTLKPNGMGESHIHLHADNCCGQNKNCHVIAYFMWRVLTGLHKEITFSFLIVGHTKFAPDTCFGLVKRKLRHTYLGCLKDIATATSASSVVNHPQLVGSQDGNLKCWSFFIPSIFFLYNDLGSYPNRTLAQCWSWSPTSWGSFCKN